MYKNISNLRHMELFLNYNLLGILFINNNLDIIYLNYYKIQLILQYKV